MTQADRRAYWGAVHLRGDRGPIVNPHRDAMHYPYWQPEWKLKKERKQ